jgi:hypothetical protein
MDRRTALKTLAASFASLCGINILQGGEKPNGGVQGEVRVSFINPKGLQVEKYTTQQQCINDFARDAIKQFPTAFDIQLKFSDELYINWLLLPDPTDGWRPNDVLIPENVDLTDKDLWIPIRTQEWKWKQRSYDKEGNGSGWVDATFTNEVVRRVFYVDAKDLGNNSETKVFVNKLKDLIAQRKTA